ncbi:MAG TPA: DNA-directed RNA polymerase subunit omega [Bacillota bacterium]|nr:DNA-directed RNA polymerase subunit omega [Bacillota bacterium]
MIYPPLDDLLKHVDNRFTLVTVAAKRAREIIEAEKEQLTDEQSEQAVTIALEEIVFEKTKYQSTKYGIK